MGTKVEEMVDAARRRLAVETYVGNEAALRRTARRYSICVDDAEEALQRGLEILLRKAPSDDPRELVRWTQTVVKHEALAVRRERERILSGPAAARPEPDREDWVALIPATTDSPAEQAVRREAVARGREALQALKPQELRALTLLAEGYSYIEIGEITGFSRTKINRCLAEGRARFRKIVAGSEDGSRCAEMGPLLSAFCDGEAGAEDAATVREHLRACPRCRATLRDYRAAPAAASALIPAIPLHRTLLERLQDLVSGIGPRLAGASESALQQAAGGGGLRGAGAAAMAKAAAICVGAVGGAACVASGVVPVPLLDPGHAGRPAAERPAQAGEGEAGDQGRVAAVDYEPAPPPSPAEKTPAHRGAADQGTSPAHPTTVQQEAAPVIEEPVASAIESSPPASEAAVSAPPAQPVESSASSAGSAAGEFGP